MAEANPGAALRHLLNAAKELDRSRSDEQIAREIGISHSALIDLMKGDTVPRPSTRLAVRVWTSGIVNALEQAFTAMEMASASEKVANVRPFMPTTRVG
jgi:hypothetical protein